MTSVTELPVQFADGQCESNTPTSPTLVGSAEPPSPPREQSLVFTGKDKLFDDTLENLKAYFFVCDGVTQRVFDDIERERDRRRRHYRFHYRPDLRRLYISVPSSPHERATGALEFPITAASKRFTGFTGNSKATRFNSDDPRIPGSKEGDFTFRPRPSVSGHRWPTLVIETGYSESLAQLKLDMHWWFAASQHQVKIVLLVKLDKDERRIRIFKYTEDWPPSLGQRITRDSSTQANAILRHTNDITPVGNSFLQYHVDRGDLVLEFALLFRRQPDANAGEGDVVISVDELENFASETWDD